jgi:GntR family transcriptional regulator
MLPSEFKIAEEYGVSQGTVRKAIEDMEAERLVVRRQGKGTFVVARSLPATHFNFFRIVPSNGTKLPAPGNRIVSLCKEAATADEIKSLDLVRDSMVYRFNRVRLFQSVPAIIEQIVLPEAVFPNFEEIYRKDPQPHIYLVYERRFGVVVMKAKEEVRAVSANDEEAALLEVAPGTALLRIDRVGYGIGERPIEMRTLLCLTTTHHYENTIS